VSGSEDRQFWRLDATLASEWLNGVDLVPGARRLPNWLDDARLASGVLDTEHRMRLWEALTDIPTKVDRTAMRVSLETPASFLDHRS
jgi:hypothetical protein